MKYEYLLALNEVEPNKSKDFMTILPDGISNVMIWKLDLCPDFEKMLFDTSTSAIFRGIEIIVTIVNPGLKEIQSIKIQSIRSGYFYM